MAVHQIVDRNVLLIQNVYHQKLVFNRNVQIHVKALAVLTQYAKLSIIVQYAAVLEDILEIHFPTASLCHVRYRGNIQFR